MELQKLTGLKKRQQIAKANHTMFLWVAAAAVVVSFALVSGQFLLKQLLFNNKVLGEKYKTERTLKQNIESIGQLKSGINTLIGDPHLATARPNPDNNSYSTLRVILDALPTKDDSVNLGASLQLAVLSRTGVTIEALSFDDVLTQATPSEEATPAAGEGSENAKGTSEIAFTFKIIGSYNQIRDSFGVVERSIRPFHITSVVLEGNDAALTATVTAKTYYQAAKEVKLEQKTIKP